MSNTTGPFGYPNISATQPLTDLAIYANSITGDAFWYLMMLLFFGVSFMTLRFKTSPEKAALTSLFATSVIATFFAMVGLMAPDYVVFFWLATGLLAMMVYYG